MSKQFGSTSHPASGTSTPSAGHALPAKPAGAGFAFKPRNVTSSASFKAASISQPPAPAYHQPSYDMSNPSYGASANQQQSYASEPHQYGHGYDYSQYQTHTPVAMSNPFLPPTGSVQGAYSSADAEHNAQMQQWQANYNSGGTTDKSGTSKPAGNANNLPLKFNRLDGSASGSSTVTPTPQAPIAIDNRKTVVRQGGGKKWEDSTLLEWGNHHRIFVGNLAGEVTDDSLLKAFSKFASVQKARVVRDKTTNKSKGFGFVSFADADEYFQAAKEMNGKYIGSHPVLIRRAETEIKATTKKEEKEKNRRLRQKQEGKKAEAAAAAALAATSIMAGPHGGAYGARSGVLGPTPGQGVQKKGGKGEPKMKVLG